MEKVFIIAEAGVNHNGDINTAYQLIDAATEAGADAVKFQTFKSELLASKYAEKAQYQKQNEKSSDIQLNMLKKLELTFEDFKALKLYCEEKKIIFMSTPFDLESIDFLNHINMKIFKISSGDITNLPYLRKINSLEKEVILSTGMATLGDIENALSLLKDCKKVSLLHCTTSYPTPYEDVNLNAMKTIELAFTLNTGYSDHTQGIEVSIAAVALGAKIIEKHFTLDKNMDGPDHKASLEPQELIKMVRSIRNIEKAMGNGIKKIAVAEIENMSVARKSIVAKTNINSGEIFNDDNLTVKRPGIGISPMYWDDIVGKTARKDYNEDELIIHE